LYQQGFNGNDFIQAGIGNVIKKGELYDRFRGRITFALHDSNGEIVGFAGRTLLENENPKYINSSESPVFSKGNNLYGLFATKSDIRKTKTVILVEGYMDFLSLFENQITNCVASMGTALTAHQATLIRRFAEEVVICYDSDNAGRMATFRGIDILTKKGLSVKIAVLPSPYDPDTYLRKKGREAFLEILEQKKPIFDYQLELLLNEYGSKSLESQIHIIRGLLPSINAMTDSIERSLKIRSLAQHLKIPESLIYNVLKGTRESEKKVKLFKTAQKDAIHGAIKAEKILVKFLLEEPTVRSMICDQVPAEYFSVPEHRRIYQAILSNLGEEFSLSDLINVFSGDELMSSCISALGSTETECYEMNEELIQSLIITLKIAELRRERSILASELAQQADYESKLLIGKRIEEIDKEIQGLKTCS
jgi:DNA primase